MSVWPILHSSPLSRYRFRSQIELPSSKGAKNVEMQGITIGTRIMVQV